MAAAEYTHSPSPDEIMEFLDGEGTAAGRTAIEAHLADCAACQVIASEQRQLSDETSAWTVGPAPASLRPPRRRSGDFLASRCLPGFHRHTPRLVSRQGLLLRFSCCSVPRSIPKRNPLQEFQSAP